MNKEEKESVAHLEWLLDEGILSSEDEPYIEKVLNLIQKQEKIIDLMARDIAAEDENDEEIVNYIKQEYLKKVVDEDVKD
ncbi:MAG: hypothetical protein IKF38_04905 [Clostridia bacterium]|nr:hypothetical protein [Clostridia bacterium]